MLELSGWGDILRGIVMLYWLAGASLFYFSVKKSSTRIGKVVSGTIVFFIFGFFPLKWQIEHALAARDHKARLERAEAIFNERCKTAGERIYRTVEGVDGIMLMKLRQGYSAYDQGATDPYGSVGEYGHGEDYILSFFLGRNDGGWLDDSSRKNGYSYVDVKDAFDGLRYRYRAYWWRDPKWHEKTASILRIRRAPTSDPEPRYGVDYEDLTTPDERALWVAGGGYRRQNKPPYGQQEGC